MINHPDLEPRSYSLEEVVQLTGVSKSQLLGLASRGELELCVFFDASWGMDWCDEGEKHPSSAFQRPLESSSGLVAIVSVTQQRRDVNEAPTWFKRSTVALAAGKAVHLQLARLPTGTPAYVPTVEEPDHSGPKPTYALKGSPTNTPEVDSKMEAALEGLIDIMTYLTARVGTWGPLVEPEDFHVTAQEVRNLQRKLKLPLTGPLSHPALNPEHPCYAPELAAAIRVWEAASDDSKKIKPKGGVIQTLKRWLGDNELSLTETAHERIATVANWNKEGGSSKSSNTDD